MSDMASRDFESRLDDALTQLVQGKPVDASREGPEAAELIGIARRLQVLAPAPEPRLEQGRRRMLAEAASLGKSGPDQRPSWRTVHRPTLAFITAVVLLASGMVFMSLRTSMGDWSSLPSPTIGPTFTATPTKAALLPRGTIPAVHEQSRRVEHSASPGPAPTPSFLRSQKLPVSVTILTWQLLDG